MKETKFFYEYLNNENPFAFLNGYDKNIFLEPKTKKRLESIQKMQPKFIPCGIDPNVLSKEHNNAMNVIIKNSINQKIHQGLQLLIGHNVEFDTSEFRQIGSGNPIPTLAADFSSVGFDTKYEEHNYNLLRLENMLMVFKQYCSIEGIEDIIIGIYRLKLLNKQNIIRNRVYEAIKDNLDEDLIAGIDYKKEDNEDYIERNMNCE